MTAHPPEKRRQTPQFPTIQLQKPISPESLIYKTTDPNLLALTNEQEKKLFILDHFPHLVKEELTARKIAFKMEEGFLVVDDPNERGIFGNIVQALADMLKIQPPEATDKIPG